MTEGTADAAVRKAIEACIGDDRHRPSTASRCPIRNWCKRCCSRRRRTRCPTSSISTIRTWPSSPTAAHRRSPMSVSRCRPRPGAGRARQLQGRRLCGPLGQQHHRPLLQHRHAHGRRARAAEDLGRAPRHRQRADGTRPTGWSSPASTTSRAPSTPRPSSGRTAARSKTELAEGVGALSFSRA